MPQATPAKIDDSANPISFPAVGRKKLTAAFDGGRLTSDGGVLLLAQAERAMGICAQLAACIADRRDPARITHKLDDILRARILAICCGYEDADDLDTLRDDPGFRLALRQTARIGRRTCQPTDHEPVGECADHTRTGVHDGGDDRHILRQLSDPACGGDAGYR